MRWSVSLACVSQILSWRSPTRTRERMRRRKPPRPRARPEGRRGSVSVGGVTSTVGVGDATVVMLFSGRADDARDMRHTGRATQSAPLQNQPSNKANASGDGEGLVGVAMDVVDGVVLVGHGLLLGGGHKVGGFFLGFLHAVRGVTFGFGSEIGDRGFGGVGLFLQGKIIGGALEIGRLERKVAHDASSV